MVFNAGSISALLQALNLTQGSYKPDPPTFSALATADNNSGPALWPPVAHSKGRMAGLMLFENTAEPSPIARDEYNECFVEPYSAPPLGNQVFPPYDPDMANLYRYRQQQSVNLGSWYCNCMPLYAPD